MKVILTSFLTLLSFYSNSQTVIKYYDADWFEIEQKKAVYYAKFVREGDVYSTTTYWKTANRIREKATYADTFLVNPIGLQMLFYRNGDLEDSIFYADGKYVYVYHYEQPHKLKVRYYTPDGQSEPVVEGLDEDGKKIRKFILYKDAIYRGGLNAWQNYLTRRGSKALDVKGVVPDSATVFVRFIIDEDGSVINTRLYKSSGVKEVDKDAVRVISESQPWVPAMRFNLPVRSFRIQAVTYRSR